MKASSVGEQWPPWLWITQCFLLRLEGLDFQAGVGRVDAAYIAARARQEVEAKRLVDAEKKAAEERVRQEAEAAANKKADE
jgi:hypothetical protein